MQRVETMVVPAGGGVLAMYAEKSLQVGEKFWLCR